MLAKLSLKILQMCVLFVSEKTDGWQLITNQLKVEGCLYLSFVHINYKVCIQIERHQQMSLVRQTITSGTGLTLNHDITMLHTSRNKALQGGIATLEGRPLCYFIARRQRMIVQKL